MPLPDPRPGLVISYAYLWRSEAELGREEGVKDRPCVIILAAERKGGELLVTVAPISHAAPREAGFAIALPRPTKARLGLDAADSWIVTTEVNRFIWPGPDLRPVARGRPDTFVYGFLPRGLFLDLRARLVENAQARGLQITQRD